LSIGENSFSSWDHTGANSTVIHFDVKHSVGILTPRFFQFSPLGEAAAPIESVSPMFALNAPFASDANREADLGATEVLALVLQRCPLGATEVLAGADAM
jgi:hypothetical protein